MADHAEVEYATATGNDYAAHEQTYHGFITLVKVSVITHRRDPHSDGVFPGLSLRLPSPTSAWLPAHPAVGGIMKIAVAAESDPGEPRVAATPETVKKMIGLGAEVAVEPGAGVKSGILDADYAAAGATVAADAMNGADIVLRVAAALGERTRQI